MALARFKTLSNKTPTGRRFVGVFSFRLLTLLTLFLSSTKVFAYVCYQQGGIDYYFSSSDAAYNAALATNLAGGNAGTCRSGPFSYGGYHLANGFPNDNGSARFRYQGFTPPEGYISDPVTGEWVEPPPEPLNTSCDSNALSTFGPPAPSSYSYYQISITDYNNAFVSLQTSSTNVCFDTGLQYDNNGNTLLCAYTLTTQETLSADLTVELKSFTVGPSPLSSAQSGSATCTDSLTSSTDQSFSNQKRQTSATTVDANGVETTVTDNCYETRIYHNESSDPFAGQTEIINTCVRLSTGGNPVESTIENTRFVVGDQTITQTGGGGVLTASPTGGGATGTGGTVAPGDDIVYEPPPPITPELLNGDPFVIPDTPTESAEKSNKTLNTISNTLTTISTSISNSVGCSDPLGCEDFAELTGDEDTSAQAQNLNSLLDELYNYFVDPEDLETSVNESVIAAGIDYGSTILNLLPTGAACVPYEIPLYLDNKATITCENLEIMRGLLTIFMWIGCGFFVRSVITRPRAI